MSRSARCLALGGMMALLVPVLLWASTYPAVGPGVLPDDNLHLTFDGTPGPFIPQRVGQQVKVQAWFLGRRVPLDRCNVTFAPDWARLDVHHSGDYGILTVTKLDVSGHDLGPDNRYAYSLTLKVAKEAETRRGVELTLDVPYRLHRLDATVKLTSGTVKPFDLRTHPDIHPVAPTDVFVWPSEHEVVLFRNKLWVGIMTKEIEWADGVPRGLEPSGVVLVAVRLRPKTGGVRWIYTNIVPATLQHRGWDDEVSRLRLPVFPGSGEIYRQAAMYFRARGVPFDGLSDISHVRGELTGK